MFLFYFFFRRLGASFSIITWLPDGEGVLAIQDIACKCLKLFNLVGYDVVVVVLVVFRRCNNQFRFMNETLE